MIYPEEQPQTGLTLMAFLTALEKQVRGQSHDEVMAGLLEYAKTLPPDQRLMFLRFFSPASVADAGHAIPGAVVPDPELPEDIAAFLENLRKQTYVEGWDWDYHMDEMVVWGDESWVDDMADLFQRLDTVFFAGDFALAASGYQQLLHAFSLPNETGEGYFPGEEDPVEMVGIALRETAARYLRAMLAGARGDDIAAFLAAYAEIDSEFMLTLTMKEILEAHPQPMPNVEQTLRELEEELKAQPQEQTAYHYGRPDWRRLLRETTFLLGGTDALGALAQERGAVTPEAYYEWILALRREGRDDEALQATRAALSRVTDAHAKGLLANALGIMLEERGEEADAFLAKQLAWRSYPSLHNFKELLAHGHADISTMFARLDEEYADLQRGEIAFSALSYDSNPMRMLFFALAGDLNQVANELRTAKGVGWSSPDHIGYPAYAMLLLTIPDHPVLPPAGSRLAEIYEYIEAHAQSQNITTLMPTSPSSDSAINILALLIARIKAEKISEDNRQSYRSVAKQVAFRRVEGIVAAQHRGAYDRAAKVAVALAEALQLAGCESEALAIPRELLALYPRHTAFRAELNGQWKASPLLKKMKW